MELDGLEELSFHGNQKTRLICSDQDVSICEESCQTVNVSWRITIVHLCAIFSPMTGMFACSATQGAELLVLPEFAIIDLFSREALVRYAAELPFADDLPVPCGDLTQHEVRTCPVTLKSTGGARDIIWCSFQRMK